MSKNSLGILDHKRGLVEILDEKGTFIQRLGHNEGKIHFVTYPEAFFLFNHNLLSVNYDNFRLYSVSSFGIFRLLNCHVLLENGITSSSHSSEIISVNLSKSRISRSKFLSECLVHSPEMNFFQTMEEVNGSSKFVSINSPQSQIFFYASKLNLVELLP
jgi:hypothetical protein